MQAGKLSGHVAQLLALETNQSAVFDEHDGAEAVPFHLEAVVKLLGGGGAPATAARIRGNARGVTVDRFAPTAARKVRLEITAPQTDPATVAARLYDMEVFAC